MLLPTITLFQTNLSLNPVYDFLYARTYSPFNPGAHFSSEFSILSVTWYAVIKDRFKGIAITLSTLLSLDFIHEVAYNLSYHLAYGSAMPYYDWSFSSKLDFAVYCGLVGAVFVWGKKWQKRALIYSASLLAPYYAIVGYWLNIPVTIGPGYIPILPTAFVPNLAEVFGWVSISLIALACYVRYNETK